MTHYITSRKNSGRDVKLANCIPYADKGKGLLSNWFSRSPPPPPEEYSHGSPPPPRSTHMAPNSDAVLLPGPPWRRSLAFTLCTTAPSVGLITIDSTGNLGQRGRGEWGGGISLIIFMNGGGGSTCIKGDRWEGTFPPIKHAPWSLVCLHGPSPSHLYASTAPPSSSPFSLVCLHGPPPSHLYTSMAPPPPPPPSHLYASMARRPNFLCSSVADVFFIRSCGPNRSPPSRDHTCLLPPHHTHLNIHHQCPAADIAAVKHRGNGRTPQGTIPECPPRTSA